MDKPQGELLLRYCAIGLGVVQIVIGEWFLGLGGFFVRVKKDYPQDCPPQDCPLGGNLEVGNPESISHQDCPPQLLCFFMNCLYLIWTWVNAGLNASVFKSLYFEEQSDSCDFRSHLKMHSGNATNVTMHDLGQAI